MNYGNYERIKLNLSKENTSLFQGKLFEKLTRYEQFLCIRITNKKSLIIYYHTLFAHISAFMKIPKDQLIYSTPNIYLQML